MIRIVLHSSAPLPSVSFSLSEPFCPGVNPNSDPNPLLSLQNVSVDFYCLFILDIFLVRPICYLYFFLFFFVIVIASFIAYIVFCLLLTSMQYTVPGFKPMTSDHESSALTTRPQLLALFPTYFIFSRKS